MKKGAADQQQKEVTATSRDALMPARALGQASNHTIPSFHSTLFMPRNKTFASRQRQPAHDDFALRHDTVTGPVGIFNPTRARYDFKGPPDGPSDILDVSKPYISSGAQVQWSSRDNRKGTPSTPLVARRH